MIARPYWGQGLGSEAARALVRHGFDRLGLARLIALIDPVHAASIRTAQSAGLKFDREIEMQGEKSSLYALTSDSYLAEAHPS